MVLTSDVMAAGRYGRLGLLNSSAIQSVIWTMRIRRPVDACARSDFNPYAFRFPTQGTSSRSLGSTQVFPAHLGSCSPRTPSSCWWGPNVSAHAAKFSSPSPFLKYLRLNRTLYSSEVFARRAASRYICLPPVYKVRRPRSTNNSVANTFANIAQIQMCPIISWVVPGAGQMRSRHCVRD